MNHKNHKNHKDAKDARQTLINRQDAKAPRMIIKNDQTMFFDFFLAPWRLGGSINLVVLAPLAL